jgi:hypothetical protein
MEIQNEEYFTQTIKLLDITTSIGNILKEMNIEYETSLYRRTLNIIEYEGESEIYYNIINLLKQEYPDILESEYYILFKNKKNKTMLYIGYN